MLNINRKKIIYEGYIIWLCNYIWFFKRYVINFFYWIENLIYNLNIVYINKSDKL